MGKTTTFAAVLIVLLTLQKPALGTELWLLPSLEPQSELWLVNEGSQPETIYVTSPLTEDVPNPGDSEQVFELAAKKTLQLARSELPQETFFQVKLHSDPSKQLFLFLKQAGRWQQIPKGRSRRLESPVPPSGAHSLVIANSSPVAQKILIQFHSQTQDLIEKTWNFKAFERREFSLPKEFSDSDFRLSSTSIEGESSVTAAYRTREGLQIFTPQVEPLQVPSGASFLFANSDRSQSFVAQIENPDLIREARAQLRNPSAKHILIARIQAGSGRINQDRLSPLRSSWSWQISEAITFSEVGPMVCTSPQWLEEFFEWAQADGQVFPFCQFRVIEELTPSP